MLRLFVTSGLILLSLTVIPASAEVTSLQTDRALYSVDMSIEFTGTIDNTDAQKLVNLMIQDPNGKIVLMTGKYADLNNAFQITVNTNDQTQFYLKGTYTAIAFVDSKQTGRTVTFDFSPDGSPVYHPAQQASPSSTPVSNPTQQEATLKNDQSGLSNNLKIQDTINITKIHSVPSVTEASESTHDFGLLDFIYPAMAACGAGLVGFIIYQRKKGKKLTVEQPRQNSVQTMEPDEQDPAIIVLKSRLANGEITLEEFKATKEVLSEP